MELLNVCLADVEPVSAVTAPESTRITQVQEEIGKRQLLRVFAQANGHRVRDLSNEALLVEYVGLLTPKS
jgi:hypothetical protein